MTDHSPIRESELLHTLATTRTIRRYTSEDVTQEDLNTILWHATRAPSGSNRQPFRFLVLRDDQSARQAKHLLGRTFREGWAKKVSEDGYRTGSGEDPESAKSRQARAMQHFVDHLESVPVIILACLIRHRDAHPTEGASIYPACQNLLLAARSLGYGGAMTMWHLGVEAELREIFEIPNHVALSACITLGRPQGSHGPVRRRPIQELVFEGSWGQSASWTSDPPLTKFTSAGPRR